MSKGALTLVSIAWSNQSSVTPPVFYSHLYFVGQNHVGLVIMVIKAATLFLLLGNGNAGQSRTIDRFTCLTFVLWSIYH